MLWWGLPQVFDSRSGPLITPLPAVILSTTSPPPLGQHTPFPYSSLPKMHSCYCYSSSQILSAVNLWPVNHWPGRYLPGFHGVCPTLLIVKPSLEFSWKPTFTCYMSMKQKTELWLINLNHFWKCQTLLFELWNIRSFVLWDQKNAFVCK